MSVVTGPRYDAFTSPAGRGRDGGDAATDLLRDLARRGTLAEAVRAASPARHAALRGAAYHVVWPIVYHQLTRPLERRRGHSRCAVSIRHLEPGCLDRFHDDVEAVVYDLLHRTTGPVRTLEGWVASRLVVATVDGYRKRRGEVGALQRPRLPGWLADALDHDPWLTTLAVELLEWVGVPVTAGTALWPLEAWASHRGRVTGDWVGSDPAVVERDVARVLAAMRLRPEWYDSYVERPLGRKQAPVVGSPPEEGFVERRLLRQVPRHEYDDARLLELAAAAVAALETRLRRGEDVRTVAAEVVGAVFGSDAGAGDLDRPPYEPPGHEERVPALLSDPEVADRVVAAAVAIVAGGGDAVP